MYDAEVETRDPAEQYRLDDVRYRQQIEYLFGRSAFCRGKLRVAGFPDARSVGGLDQIGELPFTEKDDLRHTQAEHPPFGAHLACDPSDLVRVYSTSGTTGEFDRTHRPRCRTARSQGIPANPGWWIFPPPVRN